MTDEQFNALAPYEQNYKTAIESNFSRYPGRAAIETMFNIYKDLTGSRIRLHASCGTCVLHLVQDVGRLYFKEKERREAEAKEIEPKRIKAKVKKAEK